MLLSFASFFHDCYCGETYDITFKFSRAQFKRQHEAVELAMVNLGEKVLFPSEVNTKQPQVQLSNLDVGKKGKMKVLEYKPFPCSYQVKSTISLGNEDIPPPMPVYKKKRHSEFILPVLKDGESIEQHAGSVKTSKKLQYQFTSMNELEPIVRPYFRKDFARNRSSIRWINTSLNREQKLAVSRIIKGEARPLPYVIYGPPGKYFIYCDRENDLKVMLMSISGTGKTVTLVETVLQLFLLRPDSRILISTPSNSSADLVCQRLFASGQLKEGEMARLNAFQRKEDSIPDDIFPFCFANVDESVLAKVGLYRIVITTCSTAGQFHKLKRVSIEFYQ